MSAPSKQLGHGWVTGWGFAFKFNRVLVRVTTTAGVAPVIELSLNGQVPVLLRRDSRAQPLLFGLWRGAGIGI
jgi:hypothetical protein